MEGESGKQVGKAY